MMLPVGAQVMTVTSATAALEPLPPLLLATTGLSVRT